MRNPFCMTVKDSHRKNCQLQPKAHHPAPNQFLQVRPTHHDLLTMCFIDTVEVCCQSCVAHLATFEEKEFCLKMEKKPDYIKNNDICPGREYRHRFFEIARNTSCYLCTGGEQVKFPGDTGEGPSEQAELRWEWRYL